MSSEEVRCILSLIDKASHAKHQPNNKTLQQLLLYIGIKIRIRLSNMIIWEFKKKTISFQIEEAIVIQAMYSYYFLLLDEFETVVISEFATELGRKL
jgi:hypothetical protein